MTKYIETAMYMKTIYTLINTFLCNVVGAISLENNLRIHHRQGSCCPRLKCNYSDRQGANQQGHSVQASPSLCRTSYQEIQCYDPELLSAEMLQPLLTLNQNTSRTTHKALVLLPPIQCPRCDSDLPPLRSRPSLPLVYGKGGTTVAAVPCQVSVRSKCAPLKMWHWCWPVLSSLAHHPHFNCDSISKALFAKYRFFLLHMDRLHSNV